MNPNEVSAAIPGDPSELDYWLHLWGLPANQHNSARKLSLEIVIRGLQSLKSLRDAGSNKSTSLWTLLGKMAHDLNDPTLFKEVGNAYLRDFRLGLVAKEHLERAVILGCTDTDIPPLIEAAKAIIKVKGAHESGVSEQRKGQKALSNAIRQTGTLTLVRKEQEDAKSPSGPVRLITLPADPKICMERARQALASGSIDHVKRYLSNIAGQAVPREELWEAWTQLGEMCFGSSRYSDAVTAYQAACKLSPDWMISQFNLGIALQMVCRYEEALQAYHRADALHPDHPKVWCNIGSIHFLQGNLTVAESALRKTVTLDPEYARAWDNLAGALGAQGKMDEASIACTHALMIRPNFPEASFKLAIIYLSQRQFEQALPCFAAAAADPMLSFYTNSYLAICFAELGNMMAAEHALQMAIQATGVNPEMLSEVWVTMGRARLKMFEFKRAIASFQEACRLNPAVSQHWLDLGLAYQFAQENAQASQCFDRAMKMEAAAA